MLLFSFTLRLIFLKGFARSCDGLECGFTRARPSKFEFIPLCLGVLDQIATYALDRIFRNITDLIEDVCFLMQPFLMQWTSEDSIVFFPIFSNTYDSYNSRPDQATRECWLIPEKKDVD